MDVAAYLGRINYDGQLAPSPGALRELHRQHLFTVPFENFDILLKRPIVLNLTQLEQKIIGRRRGGFCYELNGLFAQLLTELGYAVQLLSARVRREDGGFGPEFDHMLLKVELDEPWLADVGFGESFLSPLQLKSDGAGAVNGHRYSVAFDGEEWELCRHGDAQHEEVALYRFRDTPRQLSDYAEMSRYHQTSPESHFTQRSICSRAMPDGRVTLAGPRLIVTHDSKRNERMLASPDEIRICLREHFGIEFDPTQDLSPLLV
jgi:N-hydroxyarylamine O-acetyltransferase